VDESLPDFNSPNAERIAVDQLVFWLSISWSLQRYLRSNFRVVANFLQIWRVLASHFLEEKSKILGPELCN